MNNIPAPPEGYHYRGMTPLNHFSKLYAYISEEKVGKEWKDRYDHLFTFNPDDVKEVNGKLTPCVRCTVCNKSINLTFHLSSRTNISYSNLQKHIRDLHMTELSAYDQKNKEVLIFLKIYK